MTLTKKIRGGLTPSQYYINSNLIQRFFDVEDYGAVHDGVTDDTIAIQDAINACFVAGGGTVFFPNGIYIISGELQNGIGDDLVDYNSQIYIPFGARTSTRVNVRLIGESVKWVPSIMGYENESGVVLKSTIAGSGVFPSVICSRGKVDVYGPVNYAEAFIENIKVIVDAFETTTGPSMCGINFIYADTSYLNNVIASIDCDKDVSIVPENHVFGIAVGFINDNFPRIGKITATGFYYGVVLGEGVIAESIHSYYNHIGLMQLRCAYGSIIKQAVIVWNAYCLAAQQETIYGQTVHDGDIKIEYLLIEEGYSGDGHSPAWCYHVSTILDSINLLHGFVDYQLSAEAGLGIDITKDAGGNNLLIRNMRHAQTYKWTTATRPNISSSAGIVGFNTTIGKMECWDGSSWVALS